MQTYEGRVPFETFETWYRITGDIRGDRTPVVVLHGGPGSTHDYLNGFVDLAGDGRAVVHYDQVGNGRSSRLPDQQPGFWTVHLFLAELANLLSHLGIGQRYILVGHSWGGILGVEHAMLGWPGLAGLVLADAPASMPLWMRAADRLRSALPGDVQATLLHHEARGTFDHPDYEAAAEVYYGRHVCRLDPKPEDLLRTLEAKKANPGPFLAMVGRSDFHVTGSLRDWSSVERLDRIAAPTLLISGRHDQAAPETLQPFADRIRDVRWKIFEESSHMPHLEERASCMATVGDFVASCDGRPRPDRLEEPRPQPSRGARLRA